MISPSLGHRMRLCIETVRGAGERRAGFERSGGPATDSLVAVAGIDDFSHHCQRGVSIAANRDGLRRIPEQIRPEAVFHWARRPRQHARPQRALIVGVMHQPLAVAEQLRAQPIVRALRPTWTSGTFQPGGVPVELWSAHGFTRFLYSVTASVYDRREACVKTPTHLA